MPALPRPRSAWIATRRLEQCSAFRYQCSVTAGTVFQRTRGQNYLAATLEQAAAAKQAAIQSWTREVAPLDRPVFGSSLQSLRLHLLMNSPPAFAGRNIFIDASVGKRV